MQVTDNVIQKNQNIPKNKVENQIYGYKMTATTLILNSQHKMSQQKWENHFFKEEFFHKISLISEDFK